MTKLDRLNSFLSERLSAALNEIIYTVSMTMKEYEEETARIRKENDYLKEMLKVTGCSVTQANPGVVNSAVVSPMTHEQQDYTSSLEQETETQESQSEQRGLKEENCSIKTEQPSYPAEDDLEPETRETCATQTDYTLDHLQCTSSVNTQAVDQEIMDYEFPVKIKTESVNTDLNSDVSATTDVVDTGKRGWSPHNWDIIPEISDQSRVQQAAIQQPCTIDVPHSAQSAPHNRPVEFRAAFSYANRIICNNTLHCTSRHCEMQKRTIAKSSPVWKYFSLKEGDCSKAVCLMCQAVISRGVKEYTTSALLKHLRMKHGKC
ncbi:uncharacterized protein [Salminus brasiliensis]|uniref:uncharacterized protein n=1 Tax=Salminus brasiliensis TaxID=930266 RepID=UPI003B8362B1